MQLNGTAGTVAALGAQAPGTSGKAADAAHVHPATGIVVTGSQAWLIAALPALTYTAVTRNASEAATSATVAWPDGTTGTYTATVLSALFPGAVDSYTVTYSGHTVTQPQITRDASGSVIAQPALTYV